MIKNVLKKSLIALLLFAGISFTYAQTWDTISTPVSGNLILQDIVFPDGQSEIGYTGGTNVTYNGKGKVLKTIDGGDTWVVQWESDVNGTGVTSLHFFDTMNGYAGTMSGDIMKTTDGGSTWVSSDIDPLVDQGELSDLDFYDNDNGALISLYNGIYYTNDGGDTWDVATTNYTESIDLYYASQSTLFAVGYDQEIYKSTDGGDTWTFNYQGANGGPGMNYVNLGVFFKDANNGIVTSEEGDYFITSDGGDTWTSESIATQFGLMRSAYMFDADNIYICATPGEVFNTSNGGTDWASQYYDYNPAFYKITFTNNGTGFVCGSAGNGGTILKSTPISLGIAESDMQGFTVYPNPSSEYLYLEFEATFDSDFRVILIDNVGRIVVEKQFFSQNNGLTQGIDVSSLSEGMYILTILNENEKRQSQKVQIIR
jgi:photosystem II stability/assembly factor-like uncharacterized protein